MCGPDESISYYSNENLAQVFSSVFVKVVKNTNLLKHLVTVASEISSKLEILQIHMKKTVAESLFKKLQAGDL